MSIKGIAFTMYPVTDMQRALAFYRDTLGLTQAGLDSAAWVEFEVGSGTFGIGNFEQLGKAGTARSLALELSDLAAFRALLAGRGITSAEPYETPICFISSLSDPDGNQVVLHQSKHG